MVVSSQVVYDDHRQTTSFVDYPAPYSAKTRNTSRSQALRPRMLTPASDPCPKYYVSTPVLAWWQYRLDWHASAGRESVEPMNHLRIRRTDTSLATSPDVSGRDSREKPSGCCCCRGRQRIENYLPRAFLAQKWASRQNRKAQQKQCRGRDSNPY